MPMTIDFKGKLVLVTGGGRGIGLAITTSLAKAGADVAISYTSKDASSFAAEVSKTHGVTVRAYRCEVTKSSDVNQMLVDVERDYGKKVDIGVANAGTSLWKDSILHTDGKSSYFDTGPSHSCSSLLPSPRILSMPAFVLTPHPLSLLPQPFQTILSSPLNLVVIFTLTSNWLLSHTDDFRRILETNTFGPFYLARALARSWLSLPIDLNSPAEPIDVVHMKDTNLDKQILFVSSISAIVGMNPQRQAAYNASKGALTMLSKSLAGEWSHIGIYVNSISPGYVATDMLLNPTTDEERTYAAEWKRRTPVGRFATPEEVGEFITVLLSNKQGGTGFMAGSDVVLDGGYLVF